MYYCLIASLDEYSLSSDARTIDFDALRDEILGELTTKDMDTVRLLYGYYDVVNILNRLSGRDTLHNALGNLSPEDIELEIKGGTDDDDEPFVSKLPVSVAYALSIISGKVEIEDDEEKDAKSEEAVERLLLANFYAEAKGSACKYLRAWSETDMQIRQVCAAQSIAGNTEDDEELKEKSWWTALQGVLSTADFVEREHKMDSLRWDYALELLEPGGLDGEYHQFDIAAVLNYLIELKILQRWGSLSKEIGRERFEKMVKSFTSKGDINLGK